MAFKIRCPSCGASLSAPDSYHGKSIKCPKCNSPFPALRDEERQREKERLRIEAKEGKKVRENMAQIQEQGRTEGKKEGDPHQIYRPEHIPRTINCPDCGGTVSKQAATCPHCGRPFREQKAFITQADPFAELHAPIAGKKKGKLTFIGGLGIGLGSFLTIVSVAVGISGTTEGESVLLITLLGVGFIVGSYLWARKPVD